MDAEKNFILSESPNLDYTDRVEILVIVKQHGIEHIIEKKDGCRIRLDKLPSDAVMQIYDFMRRRLEVNE
jgi:hypothetical protein